MLECRHVFKKFDGKTVVKDCNFSVQKGEMIGLMGESGSGKSTLAKLLIGLEKPSQGQVLLDGQPYSVKKSGVRILLVFQDSLHSVNPNFTVEQVLTEALPKDVAREEIEAILEDVGLDKSFLSQPARQLSGGQLQRICIARGLLLKPDVLIFDEALSGLDPIVQGRLLRLLYDLWEKYRLPYLNYLIYFKIKNKGTYMKRTFETRKLYFGFPVFFLGYKDDVHGYNISTSSSVYSLGSMMVIAMRTKGNAITEITKHQQFTVNVPEKDLTKESEIAGFNSRKDKFALTGLSYTIGETVDAPLVDQCPVSIECQVLDMVECGALTNVIARVTRRVVDEELIDENDAFRSDRFSPISYMGDGDGRLYRYFSDESVKMGSIIKEIRKQEEK